MKQILALLLTMSMLVGQNAGQAPGQETPDPAQTEAGVSVAAQDPDTAYAGFALELLRASREEGENTLLSPLSVALALGMTANGAGGETGAEFTALLGMTPEVLDPYCQGLMEKYSHLGGSSQTSLANSLWCNQDTTLNDAFTQTCRDYFDAELFHTDLQSRQAMRDINRWVSKATRGKIPEVLQQPFSGNVALALINAVYFKNKFERPLETSHAVWTMDFHNADGTVSQPQGMKNGTRRETYLSHDGGQGVVLPYDDGALGLLLMLPDEDVSLTQYLETWDGKTIATLLEGQSDQRVSLKVPKFQAKWRGELREPLADMGLTRAFSPAQADFTPMGSSPKGPLYLSSVLHESVFEINETGTEAAAVTVISGTTGAARPPEDIIYLTLDRPFVYGIVDLDAGTPLFLGTLEQL